MHSEENHTPDLSLVIPVFNEAGNLEELCKKIAAFLNSQEKTWEVIFVDDGSKDGSWEKLVEEAKKLGDGTRLIRLARNYGQTLALRAGIDAACGDVIVTLDADLQNDPADIPKLLEKIEEGADLVSGWRSKRKDPFFRRRLPSRLGNLFVSFITGVKLHDFGCTLKAYRREIIKDIPLYGEMHRLIPALADWMGAEIVEVEVSHQRRESGESKYTLNRVFAVILDIISLKFFSTYATRPTHVFGLWGIISIFLSVLCAAAVIYMKVAMNVDMTGNPFLTITVMLVIVGVQLIALGLLGEVSVRTYFESLDKPPYRIKEKRGG